MNKEIQVFETKELYQMATAVARSGLFGIKTADQAMALMCVAQAEGRHPGIVARDYHIIMGRPALKADAILARFQEAGGKVKWTKLNDKVASAVFSHPAGGDVEIEWTYAMADKAMLTKKKDSLWLKYPRQMLRSRVISEGVRTVYPTVLCGTYTPEEIQDFDDKPSEPIRTDCEVVDEKSQAKRKWSEDEIKLQDGWLKFFEKGGVTNKRVFLKFGREERGEMTFEDWSALPQIGKAIRDKTTTIEAEFPTPEQQEPPTLTTEEKRAKIDDAIKDCKDETEFEQVYKDSQKLFWFDNEADEIFKEQFNNFLSGLNDAPAE